MQKILWGEKGCKTNFGETSERIVSRLRGKADRSAPPYAGLILPMDHGTYNH